ncbi:hypothetical protein AOL_s00169g205 [Orbilia oligospora ATCC 24927]|uniref:Uncharacterized protein n=1 Tax=Arthrobotrys oligospora (strain ATCC 24927 / CBS 115.81 / DSM 1491) TaxID=756982 RepID=G1XN02_ARTOA|nr:hypothetical protein AOL_s00169g205 [Orbilia oligospora ATCC 24927]EGX45599.1 hypothetical protein AOL_s00169g205 [Orbilia oligospora ATCC 24927]
MPKMLSTDDGMTDYSSDHGLVMAGSVSYIPVPGLQSDKVKALMAGPGRSTVIMYRSRKEHMLQVGDVILDESLSCIIEEVFDILDISNNRLAHQRKEDEIDLNILGVLGMPAILHFAGSKGSLLRPIRYGCNVWPASRSWEPGFPLRPPPTNMIMRETWQGQPQEIAGASSTSPSTAPDHYSRLLIIARDGGLEVYAPASRKGKKGVWLCRMTMYKVTTTEDLRTVKIPMEASRGYGESSAAARQDTAKQIIRQLHNIEK